MCVKLPATLNTQLEYVFHTWGNAQSFGYHYFVTNKKILSGDAQCCNKDCCECLLVRPRDGNLTQDGDPTCPPPLPSTLSEGKPLIGALVLGKSCTRSHPRLNLKLSCISSEIFFFFGPFGPISSTSGDEVALHHQTTHKKSVCKLNKPIVLHF